MLKRVRISGYKSLRDVEVELQPLSVLFGPNASGKSNFLDALQLLSRICSRRTLKDAFALPHRGKPLESFTFAADGIKGLLGAESREFCIEVDVELSPAVVDSVNRQIREMRRGADGDAPAGGGKRKRPAVRETFLRYRIAVEILPKSGFLRVADEYLAALNRRGEPTGKRQPFLSRKGEKLHLRMEGQSHPVYYDRYLDHSVLSLPHYPPHYPHLTAMRRELENWLFFYFEPRERMRTPNPVKEVRHVGLMGEELAAFLNTLKTVDPRQFHAVEKALHAIVGDVDGILVDVNELGEVELRLVENGVPVPARVVSEGTLRILGLLALSGAGEQPALIGFEEPENGVHPRRIRLIADMLKTRASLPGSQYIVTTHSPLLPDLLPDESLFVCRKTAGYTEIRPFSTWGSLGRRNDIHGSMDGELSPSERMLRGDFDA